MVAQSQHAVTLSLGCGWGGGGGQWKNIEKQFPLLGHVKKLIICTPKVITIERMDDKAENIFFLPKIDQEKKD